MHPRICDFVSIMVYDHRLQAEPSTALRMVKVPDGAERLCVDAGLFFVPVMHDGNSRSSEEEAEMIRALARTDVKTLEQMTEVNLLARLCEVHALSPHRLTQNTHASRPCLTTDAAT